jgi:hypothetical protein
VELSLRYPAATVHPPTGYALVSATEEMTFTVGKGTLVLIAAADADTLVEQGRCVRADQVIPSHTARATIPDAAPQPVNVTLAAGAIAITNEITTPTAEPPLVEVTNVLPEQPRTLVVDRDFTGRITGGTVTPAA